MINSSQLLALIVPSTAFVLAFLFRSKKSVRTLAVIVVTINIVLLIHFGLRLVARNVALPPLEQYKQQVDYIEAWNEGCQATQEKVDAYRFSLLALTVSLAGMALLTRAPAALKD